MAYVEPLYEPAYEPDYSASYEPHYDPMADAPAVGGVIAFDVTASNAGNGFAMLAMAQAEKAFKDAEEAFSQPRYVEERPTPSWLRASVQEDDDDYDYGLTPAHDNYREGSHGVENTHLTWSFATRYTSYMRDRITYVGTLDADGWLRPTDDEWNLLDYDQRDWYNDWYEGFQRQLTLSLARRAAEEAGLALN